MKIKEEWISNQMGVDIDDDAFLRNPVICGTMFVSDRCLFDEEYEYIQKHNSEYLKLFESPTDYGSPLVFDVDGKTYNPNDIHHLYHVCRYEHTAGKIRTKQNLQV